MGKVCMCVRRVWRVVSRRVRTELLDLLGLELVEVHVGARRLAHGKGDARAGGLPLDGADDVLQLERLDGDVLLAQAEELERGERGLLRLGRAVDLHSQVVALALPVQAAVGHVEQVLRAALAARGDVEEHHAGGRVARLGDPVAEDVVGGRPAEVLGAGRLDRLLLEQVHRRRLVHRDHVLAEARQVLAVVAPHKGGPHGAVVGEEAAELLARAEVPDDDALGVLGVVVRLELRRDRHHVALARREVDELNAGVSEADDARKLGLATDLCGAAPEHNALHVEAARDVRWG